MDANRTASLIEKSVRSMAAEVSTAATVRSEFTRTLGELWAIELFELSGFRALDERTAAEGKMHGETLVKGFLASLERAGVPAASVDATLKATPQVLADAFITRERQAGHLFAWGKKMQSLEKHQLAMEARDRPLLLDPRLHVDGHEAAVMKELNDELKSINERPSNGRHFPAKKGKK